MKNINIQRLLILLFMVILLPACGGDSSDNPPSNLSPVAAGDSFTVDEGSSNPNLDVSANDSDADGSLDLTSIVITVAASNGTAIANADGTINYNHDGSETLTDTVSYTIADNSGAVSSAATVSFTITPVNDAPVAVADSGYSVAEGGTLNVLVASGVLVNDTDAESDSMTAVLDTNVSNGALTLNANGSFSYLHNGSETTSDSFTYHANDGQDSSVVSVSIAITPVDDATVITGNTGYTGNEGDTVAGDLNATDAEGLTDGTYFSVSAQATNGTAAINAATGIWSFAPTDVNWFGSDSFTVTVTDDLGGTTGQLISISLVNVDDPAVITGNSGYTGNEGDTVTGDLNATDVDGLTDGTYFSVTTPATSGMATINAGTGAWSFTPPDANWFGSDNFTVTVTDDLGGTTTQMISINLSNTVDAAVITGDTGYTGNEGDTVTGDLDATDVDGLTDGTYFSVTTPATNGTGSIDAITGAWSFTPTDVNWFGSDSFTVTVTDDLGGTTTQAISITLANVDDAAVITGDTGYTGNEGDTVTGDLDATDVDGLSDGTYFTVTTPATNGTAAIDAGTGVWSFTPTDADWFGSDSFTVTVTDDEGGTANQLISISLANVDDAAVITGDTGYTGNEGDTVAGDLNATDVDGLADGTYFAVTTPASNGTAVINAGTGAWGFTPTDADWFGSDSFTVTVTDDEGGTAGQLISISLTNVDDATVITGDTGYTGNEGDTVAGDLNATDADGLTDGTYFTVTTPATNGTAAISAGTGAWSFTPTDANWFGSDSFTVTVTDDEGGTAGQLISISLSNVDDAAVITGDTGYTGNEGDTVAGDLDATDVDGLTDASYFSVTTPATSGLAAIDAVTGVWSFTPTDADWFGSDSFTVTVMDDEGGTTTQPISITLANVDDAAVITGDTGYTGNEGDTVAGDLDATDVDGLTDGTYFTVTTPATNGTAAIDAVTGAWSFTPTDINWFGSDSFTVTVTDDEGGTTTQAMSISLANVQDAPVVITPQNILINEDSPVVIHLGTDVDGDSLTYTLTPAPTNGVITGTAPYVTYTPNTNYNGSDSFSFTLNDGTVDSAIGTVTITISAVNDAPVANDGGLTTGAGGVGVDGTLTASDVDIPSPTLTYQLLTLPTKGDVTAFEPTTGAFTYTPTTLGADSFTFNVNDGARDSNVATITVTPPTTLLVPGTPTGEAATAGDQRVTLNWTAVDYAESYNVYRSLVSGVYTDPPVTVNQSYYYDDGVTNSTPYFYIVTAVNSVGESVASGEVTATPVDIAISSLSFTDSNLASCVSAHGVTYVNGLTILNCSGHAISDLSGIEQLTSLNGLYLSSNSIVDVSPLANLTQLSYLSIWGNPFNSGISPLRDLVNMETLEIGGTGITDISPLANMSNMTTLHLLINNISDIRPLAGMTALTDLRVDANTISDITPLSALTNLTILSLYSNHISDISSLSGKLALTTLTLYDNNIFDVSVLSTLSSLDNLDIGYNNIFNIGALSGLITLTDLTMSYNDIYDVTPLAGLGTNLNTLLLDNNKITDVNPLASLVNLTELAIQNNSIGGENVGNVDDLVSLINATSINLTGNVTMSCTELTDLVSLLPDGSVVTPNVADPGVNCTAP